VAPGEQHVCGMQESQREGSEVSDWKRMLYERRCCRREESALWRKGGSEGSEAFEEDVDVHVTCGT